MSAPECGLEARRGERVALCLLAGVAPALAAGDTGDDGGLVERLSVIEVQHGYSERRDYEMAAMEYRQALDLDPRLPAAFHNWSNDLLRQGECRGAIRRFSKSLRLYQTDVWALNNRGLAYMKLGKREKARRDLEGALRIDPGFEPARRNLRDLEKASPCERLAPTMF